MYWGQFEASHDLFEPCFQLMKTMVGSNLKEEQLRQVVNRTVLFVDKVTLSLLDVDVDLFANRVAKAADISFLSICSSMKRPGRLGYFPSNTNLNYMNILNSFLRIFRLPTIHLKNSTMLV